MNDERPDQNDIYDHNVTDDNGLRLINMAAAKDIVGGTC